jgi:hypothetical protein
MTPIVLLVTIGAVSNWAVWLIYCYAIARRHPKRAATIIHSTGIAYPFPGRKHSARAVVPRRQS